MLAPPTGSGLRTLPADSALVQSFAGHSRLLVVGLAQWPDGRGADYQSLVARLQPLLDKVTEVAAGHDRGRPRQAACCASHRSGPNTS
ncbi:hypothetical protein [Streptomyces sp. NPDC048665]|uniref:hypothetical protein n=1 Tax=unclassified Streptomyces TaxID=2593676 RepID=UPI0034204D8F